MVLQRSQKEQSKSTPTHKKVYLHKEISSIIQFKYNPSSKKNSSFLLTSRTKRPSANGKVEPNSKADYSATKINPKLSEKKLQRNQYKERRIIM